MVLDSKRERGCGIMRDVPTLRIADHVNRMGIKLSVISRETGIPDGILRRSLATKERDLRAEEFLSICKFLGKQPFDFYDKATPTIHSNA